MKQETPQQPQEESQREPRRRGLWAWTRFGEKDLWDWLQLLIIPIVLAVGGFLFSWVQDARQQEVEERRAKAQLEAEEQRAQNVALQSYLEEMGSLLLDEDLRDSSREDEVREVADVRTLAVLDQVGPSHKQNVVRFLYQARLIHETSPPGPTLVRLAGANLRDADLSQLRLGPGEEGPPLPSSDFALSDLSGANLSRASLGGAILVGADLSNADMSNTYLADAVFRQNDPGGLPQPSADANLNNADLSGANLNGADVSQEQLDAARTLEGATLPDGSTHE